MNWSSSVQIPRGSSLQEVTTLVRGMTVSGNDDCPNERDAAVAYAKDSVLDILESNLLGKLEDTAWFVVISGNSNPGNESRPEWSNPGIRLQVEQFKGDVVPVNAGESGGGKS